MSVQNSKIERENATFSVVDAMDIEQVKTERKCKVSDFILTRHNTRQMPR